MTTADDRWLAAARTRSAAGTWERDADAIFADLRRQAELLRSAEGPAGAPQPRCPYCASHPEMLVFRRRELRTIDPLRLCPQCYGFWAVGDSLARGVADPGDEHPALAQALAPRRCRSCHGRLKPDNSCRSCGKSLPLLDCPECRRPMDRYEKDGILLDQCPPCRGTWFDIGEIVAVHRLPIHQGLAASTVDEHAADDEPPGWAVALDIISRLVFPFLPF